MDENQFIIAQMWNLVLITVTLIGVIATAFGVWMAYRTLRANHEWNRRQYIIDIMREWGVKAIAHAKEIEKAFPTLLDEDSSQEGNELTRKRAIEIYTCKPDHPDWELRYHIYEILNYFEIVATAYLDGVADDKIIEGTFRDQMIRYYDRMHNFIKIVEERRGHNPWPPYKYFVEKFKSKEVIVRRKTDD